jgi:hypothetical protein
VLVAAAGIIMYNESREPRNIASIAVGLIAGSLLPFIKSKQAPHGRGHHSGSGSGSGSSGHAGGGGGPGGAPPGPASRPPEREGLERKGSSSSGSGVATATRVAVHGGSANGSRR